MRNIFKIWLLLLPVFALQACVEKDRQEREVIHQAELLMQEQPDSALHLLQTLQRHSLTGETLARYALIHSIAQDKSGLDVTSDSLLRIAYDYYCRHPEDSLYARSQYYMGLYLFLTEQPDSSYNCLLRAKTVSEADKDYYTAYLATDRMRKIAENSDTTLCLNLSKEAYQLYLKQGADNPVNEVYLLIGIGDSYSRCGDKDSTLYYYDLALNKAQSAGDSIAIASVLQNISNHYRFNRQYKEALDYAQRALNYRGYLDKRLATLLARCCMENAEYDKARQYINALPPSDSKENQLVKLGLQHGLSAKTGDADAAQEYFHAACNVAADMYLSTQKDKLELYRKNLHEALERQRAEHQSAVLLICLGFSFALLILLSLLFINHKKNARREQEHLLQQHQLKLDYEKQIAKERLDYKDSQISMMRSLIMERCHFRQSIEEQKKSGKHITLTPEDWTEIAGFLNAMSDDFLSRLKEAYPNLREKDYQFCMLVRLKFPNKDLANMCGISEPSVKQKLVDYKERLQVPAGGMSFKQFISKF